MRDFKPTGWLPDYVHKAGVLTPAECQLLMDSANEKFYSAMRIDPDGNLTVDTQFRNCQTAHIPSDDPAYKAVVDKILPLVDELNANYGFEYYPELDRMIPWVNVNRYADNHGMIGRHTDVGGYEDTENCKLAIVILLRDDFEGGEFQLDTGRRLYPFTGAKAGDLIAFPTFVIHSVAPVLSGERTTAVIWLRGPRFR